MSVEDAEFAVVATDPSLWAFVDDARADARSRARARASDDVAAAAEALATLARERAAARCAAWMSWPSSCLAGLLGVSTPPSSCLVPQTTSSVPCRRWPAYCVTSQVLRKDNGAAAASVREFADALGRRGGAGAPQAGARLTTRWP